MKDYFEVPRKYIVSPDATQEEPVELPADEPLAPSEGEFRRQIQYASRDFNNLGFSSANRFSLTNQIYLEIKDDAHLYHHARSDGRDVYFRDSLGVLLPFEMVSYNAGTGRWWILANNTVKANRLVYMYYGDTTENTDASEDIWTEANSSNNELVVHSSYLQKDGLSSRAINSAEFDGAQCTSSSIQRNNEITDATTWVINNSMSSNKSFMACVEYRTSCVKDGDTVMTLCSLGRLNLSTRNNEICPMYRQVTDAEEAWRFLPSIQLDNRPHILIMEVEQDQTAYDSVAEETVHTDWVGLKHVYYDSTTNQIVAETTIRLFGRKPTVSNAETALYQQAYGNGDEDHIRLSEFRVHVSGLGGVISASSTPVTSVSDLAYTGGTNDIKCLYAIMFHQDSIRTVSSISCEARHDQLMLV